MKKFNEIIEEMTTTSTGLKNEPTETEKQKLFWVYCFLIYPIEKQFGITVSSGYRSELVNNAVGGVQTSQHRLAEACDFVPNSASLQEVFDWCRENLTYGQLIMEGAKGKFWIHISMPRTAKSNMMNLVMKDGKYTNA